MKVNCPYCAAQAVLVDGSAIYGSRFRGGKYWVCWPCKAWVGCHKDSRNNAPFGTLANAELRALRRETHALFDPHWQDGSMTRREAYAWFAGAMGMTDKQCHIGKFNADECRAAIALLKGNRNG